MVERDSHGRERERIREGHRRQGKRASDGEGWGVACVWVPIRQERDFQATYLARGAVAVLETAPANPPLISSFAVSLMYSSTNDEVEGEESSSSAWHDKSIWTFRGRQIFKSCALLWPFEARQCVKK